MLAHSLHPARVQTGAVEIALGDSVQLVHPEQLHQGGSWCLPPLACC